VEGGPVPPPHITIHSAWSPATTTTPTVEVEADSPIDLDITLIEMVDRAHLIKMADDGCGGRARTIRS
jgi:hypothetical protein